MSSDNTEDRTPRPESNDIVGGDPTVDDGAPVISGGGDGKATDPDPESETGTESASGRQEVEQRIADQKEAQQMQADSNTTDSTTEIAQEAATAAKADTSSESTESGVVSKLRNSNDAYKWPVTLIVIGSVSPFWIAALKQSVGMPAHHYSMPVLAGMMLLAASGMAIAYMYFMGAAADESMEAMERAAEIAQQLTEARQSSESTHTESNR